VPKFPSCLQIADFLQCAPIFGHKPRDSRPADDRVFEPHAREQCLFPYVSAANQRSVILAADA
jgi:hypothetical protein